MKTMILVILTAAITNNYVLVKFLGICPFLGVSKKLDQATGMSLAVIFVEVLANCRHLADLPLSARGQGRFYLYGNRRLHSGHCSACPAG